MFKELWQLIKWFFQNKPSDVENIKLVKMKHFPFDGYSAMSWCGHLVTKKDFSDLKATTIRHETIHLMQAKQYKYWICYYAKYVWEWIKGNPIIHPSSSAYYTIPFEMEAYANCDVENYSVDYNPKNIERYIIKKRKKTYKEHKSKGTWMTYLKSL